MTGALSDCLARIDRYQQSAGPEVVTAPSSYLSPLTCCKETSRVISGDVMAVEGNGTFGTRSRDVKIDDGDQLRVFLVDRVYRACDVLDSVIGLVFLRVRILADASIYPLLYYQRIVVQASVFVVGMGKGLDAFATILPPDTADFEMYRVSTACDDYAMVKDFESSYACLMMAKRE